MITTLYYSFWVFLVLIYALLFFTVFKLYKKKEKITKFFLPISLNSLLSFIGVFLLSSSIIGLIYDLAYWYLYLGILIASIIFMVGPNILLYKLYYKRKNKLTFKQYLISSLYGLMIFILYLIQINLLPW